MCEYFRELLQIKKKWSIYVNWLPRYQKDYQRILSSYAQFFRVTL